MKAMVERVLDTCRRARSIATGRSRRPDPELAHLYEVLPMALCSVDRGLRFTRVNERLAQLTAAPVEAHIGRSMAEVAPHVAAQFEAICRRVIDSGEAVSEVGIPDAGAGADARCLCDFHPLVGADGAVHGVTVAVRQPPAAPGHDEEFYRPLAELMADYAFRGRIEPDGRLRPEWIMPGFTRVTGYTADEVESRGGLRSVWHPDDAPLWERHVRQLLAGRIDAVEARIVTKGGATRWLRAAAHPIRDEADGRVVGVYGAVQDITDWRREMEALRQRAEQLQLAVEASGIGWWDWDLRGGDTHYSTVWKRLLGYQPHEFTGSREEWSAAVHPDDRSRVRAAVEAYFDNPSGEYEQVFRLRHKDGGYRWVLSRAAVRLDAAGKPARMLGAHIDITRRQQAEELVRQQNEALERGMALHAAQLELANRELEAFSYSVSHDLRAPLRAISGYATMLLEDHATALDTAAQQLLGRVLAGARRMNQLIDALLNLSRIGQGETRAADVDLGALAAEVAAELQKSAPERCVRWIFASDLVVRGDAQLLRLAIENLIGNAWKYTSRHPQATIELGVTTRAAPTGEVGGVPPRAETVYFVRDDGAGFDPTYAHVLFRPFRRLHGSDEFEGTGIGLATVARIVARHGGRIWAEGAVEQGATVYFTLGQAPLGGGDAPG